MAEQKLSLPLFPAKARTPQAQGSALYLHFIASIQHDRNLYTFVCETRPLDALKSAGLPKRCAFCGQHDPIGSEKRSTEHPSKDSEPALEDSTE